eukprot:scaffold300_cov173-Ochromonas_danica.AAC.10
MEEVSLSLDANKKQAEGVDKNKKGLFTPVNIILVMAVIFCGVVYKEHCRKSWFVADYLSKEMFPSRPFVVKEFPTTYYKQGEIGKVLQGWHKGEGLKPYLHLYRLNPSETFQFDPSVLTTKVQVEKIMNPCDRVAKPNYYYSSFAKMDNSNVIVKLVESLGVPGLNPKQMTVEHAFVGNFPEDKVTAFVHANALTSSMAIQYAGKKGWLFFSPDVMRNRENLDSFPGGGAISIPTKGPDGPYEVYYLDSQPGDIIFFSENWGHAVFTKKGPNFMLTLRKMEIGNVLRRPFDWFNAVYHAIRYRPQYRLGRDTTPFNELLPVYMAKMNALCDDGKRAPWDDDMTNLLLNGLGKNKSV